MHIPGYQIERELGQGGMAIVYLAMQESLHRHVALKIIKPILTTDDEFAQRFLREGRIIAQLNDPHIVTASTASGRFRRSFWPRLWAAAGRVRHRRLRRRSRALTPESGFTDRSIP